MTSHPLDRLSADEITRNREILAAADLVTARTAFALVNLAEPDKAELANGTAGRVISSLLLDLDSGAVTETLVDLGADEVRDSRSVDVINEGQPPILVEEFSRVEELLHQDPQWIAAMERRGITDQAAVRISALSAGRFGFAEEDGRRLVRCLAFLQLDPDDNAWAHPIDGVVAYVDLITGETLKVIDDRLFDIPQRRYNFHDSEQLPTPRETQRPIVITQPEGPSFSVEGDQVTWEKWQFRIGYNQVEGLTLHQLSFLDQGRQRSVVHRASIAEMVVPYGDPGPVRFWQNYFDAGEYSLGKMANSLELGCDCLGEIFYFDATVAASDGHPRVIKNAICMHEEDASILWKHSDDFYRSADVRRNRRLVISFFVTVGNYDYGFYWYLYLDGRIEFECKATGVVFVSAYQAAGVDAEPYPFASEVAPGIGAPYHQHLFSARLAMAVDGDTNAVEEVDAVRVPVGPQNQYGNAFSLTRTRLRSEAEGARLADAAVGRTWHVINPQQHNYLGQPVGYVLRPRSEPNLLADPSSSVARRAVFTTKDLWVTRATPGERFPAGTYVNQNEGGNTIADWIKRDADIDGQDIVVWHTFGLTHFPRTEDWPIMPVDSTGFSLVPHGFFDQNPTLDVPAPPSHQAQHTHAAEGSGDGCCSS